MTDEKFVFIEDLREKKSAARGSVHKKNGSKSKLCSLPSDNLTPAQIRKLNGEVCMYKIGQPISWEEFKSYPVEMQQKWMDTFVERFDCKGNGLQMVFGVSQATIYPNLKRMGVVLPEAGTFTENKGEKIRAWIEEYTEKPKVEEVVVEPKPVVEVKREPAKPEMPYFVHTLQQGSMQLSGTATEIFHTLFGIFRDAKIELSIDFVVIPEPEPEIEEEPEFAEEPEIVEEIEVEEHDPNKVNLNSCNFKDLRNIGVSPNIAATIMQMRPFQRVEDLLRVPGVTKSYYNVLSPKVTVYEE